MTTPGEAVGLVGGGLIGCGWAARYALSGLDVRLYDPAPDTERRVGEVLGRARAAWRQLGMGGGGEGAVTVVATVEEALAGATFVQESVPEQLELKIDLFARLDALCAADVVIASSTSGLRPTLMQARMAHPERLVVGHPFNPVYLLPLVEVLGGEQTALASVERAEALYRRVSMRPLRVRHEIDGFIADRLQEALWREALGLVADGVATVEEVDDAIRFGPGLRWAFMGSFLAYRIAGGEQGMRHFMAHFGPALTWPWSRLTDVPELTDDLIDRIVEQSDTQAAGRSIADLEEMRDANLVAILTALDDTGHRPS